MAPGDWRPMYRKVIEIAHVTTKNNNNNNNLTAFYTSAQGKFSIMDTKNSEAVKKYHLI